MPTTAPDAANVTSIPEADERPRTPQQKTPNHKPFVGKSGHSRKSVPDTKGARSSPAPRASEKARRARVTASRRRQVPRQRISNESNVGTTHDDSIGKDSTSFDGSGPAERAVAIAMPTTVLRTETSKSNETIAGSNGDHEATTQLTGEPSSTPAPHDTSVSKTFKGDAVSESAFKIGRPRSLLR